MPSDADIVKRLMKQNLLGVFSERDAEKRRSRIAKIWDTKGIFIDSHGRYVGHTAINDAAEQVWRRFPDFTFSELADGDAYIMEMHTLMSDVSPGASVHRASHRRSLVSMCWSHLMMAGLPPSTRFWTQLRSDLSVGKKVN